MAEIVYPFEFLLSDMPKSKPPKLEAKEEEEPIEPLPAIRPSQAASALA